MEHRASDRVGVGAEPLTAHHDQFTSAVSNLNPGYFALVMATAVISISAHLNGLRGVDLILYGVAAGGYAVLATLTVLRLILFPKLLIKDLTSQAEGFAFLTAVAASNILGGASVVLFGWWTAAWVFWFASIVLWVVLLYTTLVAVVILGPKPGIQSGINGTWFLLTVSTESIVGLGAYLLRRSNNDLLAFVCIALFCLGIVLYLIVMTMVFLRWTIRGLQSTEAAPPAWIATGAVAITVLGGSHLLRARTTMPRIDRIAPSLEVLVMLAWATATFWLPLMIAIAIWRHIIRRVPVRYDPSWWAVVFPIGMYSAATFRMDQVIDLPSLHWLSLAVLVIALAMWTLTFVGLTHQGIRAARRAIAPDTARPR